MTKEMNEAEAYNDTSIPTGKMKMSKAEVNSNTGVSTGKRDVNIEIYQNGQKNISEH